MLMFHIPQKCNRNGICIIFEDVTIILELYIECRFHLTNLCVRHVAISGLGN